MTYRMTYRLDPSPSGEAGPGKIPLAAFPAPEEDGWRDPGSDLPENGPASLAKGAAPPSEGAEDPLGFCAT